MEPFFRFFGAKWRTARYYPEPLYDVVVEPFAGAAGYSVFWEPEVVLLYDADEIIVGVWDYLIHASEREILNLPLLRKGQRTSNLKQRLPQEAKWFLGFWINPGVTRPRDKTTAFSTWSAKMRQRVADQLCKIRKWEVRQSSYEDVPDHKATWFIDPPYIQQGHHYRYHDIDYDHLGVWCESRRGQVMVCEAQGADWLDFEPVTKSASTRGSNGRKRRITEVMYYHDSEL